MGKFGKIVWQDLTVEHAEEIKDFYCAVVGWTFSDVSQGAYNDFNITNNQGEVVAGICHKRGEIATFPSQWLNYVTVENLAESIATCTRLGGKVVDGPKTLGGATIAVIQDPAGAFFALMEE